MANSFSRDILIQAEDPKSAAIFYVEQLGFKITEETPAMINVCGGRVDLYIERGPELGPVLKSPSVVSKKSGPAGKTRLRDRKR